MPLPLADFDKNPVIFVDGLTPILSDLHGAFNTLFVLTSKIAAGRTRLDVQSILEQSSMHTVANNLHARWATPYDADSNLEDEIEAWHGTCDDRTPTSFLIVTNSDRCETLGHTLRQYAITLDGPVIDNAKYIEACHVLHSQTSFAPFDSDWY